MKLIIIGSASDVHLKYNSPYVSAYHAEILLLDNGDIILTDKASRNGTFVNDERITPNKEITVRRGDNIRFADVCLDWNSIPAQIQMPEVKEIRGIGTNYRNKYQLQGDKVSRFHATLKLKKDGKWYLQDHSKNGTSVNGTTIPQNQDILLKKKDTISCAGVNVPNPYTGKKNGGSSSNTHFPWRWVFGGIGIASVVTIIALLFSGGFKSCSTNVSTKTYSDVELYSQYKSSIVLMVGFYHYTISAGNLDLASLGLPTDVVSVNGKLVPVNGDRTKMHSYTGTGFFVSEDGKIMTNLHIARPWLFTEEATQISDAYKRLIAEMATQFPQLNAFTGQVKVEGALDYLGFIPNGEYFTEENLIACRELEASNDTEADVALLQSVKKQLPNATTAFVNLNNAVVADSEIKVGEHIYTMGFPLGLNAQNLNSADGIQLLARGGNITQESSKYSFGFDAASFQGASGSPIFDDNGRLVGILNAGFTKSQGFNYGIKAIYAKELMDKTVHQ